MSTKRKIKITPIRHEGVVSFSTETYVKYQICFMKKHHEMKVLTARIELATILSIKAEAMKWGTDFYGGLMSVIH